ncbi:MAG: sigma-70 family RNA polymerase sigma factor [Nannocystaceae bacterium]|nr:sigma-70 family RNA polymerase sigma factor [Myxococcales bacterium]
MDDDTELYRRWSTGDSVAGHELVRRNLDSLLRFLRSKVGADASDLAHETLTRCITARDRFRGDSKFRTFMLSVATNVLREYIRKRIKNSRADFQDVTAERLDPTPSEVLSNKQDIKLLLFALRKLPIDQQLILELAYWENLTSKEIGVILERPPGTIRRQLGEARASLERTMAQLPTPNDLRTSMVMRLVPGRTLGPEESS